MLVGAHFCQHVSGQGGRGPPPARLSWELGESGGAWLRPVTLDG